MKGSGIRPHRRTWRLAIVGLLLPLAVSSAAQTPLRWESQAPAQTLPTYDVATTAPAFAAPVTPIPLKPLAPGFDVQQFEAIAQELVANQRIPGLALAIVQNGRILTARGYGITDVSAAEPVDAHTVFRLASLSKSFASTLTGMLVSEGSLRWDSKLTDYMPDFRLSDPTAAQKLTVADILSHRVGLTHNTYDRDLEGSGDYRTLLQKMAYAPMACAPGECYAYQNIAFSTIGDIVFAATGHFYSETVQRRIFKPLGMNDASYGLEGIEASPRWARPHVRARGGWVALMPKPNYYRVAPAAGVNASISDLAQYLIAQGGHRPDVLPAPLLATLHASLIDTPSEIRGSAWRRERVYSAGYALGWRVYNYSGHELVFHAGAVQGYRGLMALMPESDLGIAILWNSESSLPSGLLPTILDRAIGLPAVAWVDTGSQHPGTMMATVPVRTAGVDSSTSDAAPE